MTRSGERLPKRSIRRGRAYCAAEKMPPRSDIRQRMIESAVLLFRERGPKGTSFADVLERSGAPRGSVYHHFQGGKPQLVEDATRFAADVTIAGAQNALAEDDPVAAVRSFTSAWSKILRAADFEGGCPMTAVTLEGTDEPVAHDIAAETFAEWERLFAASLRKQGVPRPRAASLASLALASIEGAIVLCRAYRNVRPLRRVSDELEPLIADAIGSQTPASARQTSRRVTK
jgi:AcrR family transcriptional regulator